MSSHCKNVAMTVNEVKTLLAYRVIRKEHMSKDSSYFLSVMRGCNILHSTGKQYWALLKCVVCSGVYYNKIAADVIIILGPRHSSI